jgi:hypothetical protein
MKIIAASLGCLLLGLVMGGYVGFRYHEKHITNEAVKLMMEGMESADGEHAAEAARAIELINSGESSNAVQLLSSPIANYYHWYAVYADTDRERRLRAMIEQLASTNQIVANAIHSKTQ